MSRPGPAEDLTPAEVIESCERVQSLLVSLVGYGTTVAEYTEEPASEAERAFWRDCEVAWGVLDEALDRLRDVAP